MNEGYLALLLAIFRNVTQEQAFRILDGKTPKAKKNRKWTDDDFQEIAQCRKEGLKWNEIGEMYGMKEKSAQKAYRRYVKKRKEQYEV